MRSIAILVLLFFTKLLVAQNLIVNPGAEDNDLNGWTKVSGNWVSSWQVAPRTGNWHFYAGDNTATVEIYQDVDVSAYASDIDAGNAFFKFLGYMSSWPSDNDRGRIIVEYRNGNTILGTPYDSNPQNYDTWTEVKDERYAPVNTRKIRIRLISIRSGFSGAGDGYFDDLSLTVVLPTPVTLIFFEAQLIDESVRCYWQTANESNNKYFTIEKSQTGQDWNEIGIISGAVNTNLNHSYSFEDHDPIEGIQYYRLKQTDMDGTYTYSSIQSVTYKTEDSFPTIHQNTNGQVVLQGESISYIELFDGTGKLLRLLRPHSESEEYLILGEALSPGFYIFNIQTPIDQYTLKYIAP